MTTPEFRALNDDELNAIRARLIAGGGDLEKSGVTAEEVRNAVYTKALRVNPNVEAEDAAAKAAKRKKKESGPTTRQPTLSGDDVNDLLG